MSLLKFRVIQGKIFKARLSTSSVPKKPRKIKDKLIRKVAKKPSYSANKITIVGLGNLGHDIALGIVAAKLTNECCLIDKDGDKAHAQAIDIQHGAQFANDLKIYGGDDFKLSANSRLCIIAAGEGIENFKTGFKYFKANSLIVQMIVESIMEYNKEPMIFMISNPVDIMTYLAWKTSGLPRNKVFGLGTVLDTSRFKYLLAERLKIAASSIHAYVIGEHGNSSVPVWSGVNVAGTRLRDLDQCIGRKGDSENFHQIKKDVRRAASKVFDQIGYTAGGPALCVNEVLRVVFGDTNRIMPVCTHAQGLYSIPDDVVFSLPCVMNSFGATSIIKQNLTKSEKEKLQKSAEILHLVQLNLKI